MPTMSKKAVGGYRDQNSPFFKSENKYSRFVEHCRLSSFMFILTYRNESEMVWSGDNNRPRGIFDIKLKTNSKTNHIAVGSQQCSTIRRILIFTFEKWRISVPVPPTAFLTWLVWLSQKSFVKFFHCPCPTANGDRSLLWKFQLVYPPEAKVGNFLMLSV